MNTQHARTTRGQAATRVGGHRLTVTLCATTLSTILAGTCLGQTDKPDKEVVRVESGMLRGTAGDGIVSFLGVPYAAPPVGPLRWAAPKPAEPWEGIRDATKPEKPAAQGAGEVANGSTNEDCLHLNIVVPRTPAKGRLRPVMVWLHGEASRPAPPIRTIRGGWWWRAT